MPASLSLTKDNRADLMKAFKDGMPTTKACSLAGIGRSTFYDWMRRGDVGEAPFGELLRDIRLAQAEGTQALLEKAHVHATEDPAMVRFLLATQDPDVFGKEPRRMDVVQEAYVKTTDPEVVQLMASNPEIQAAVVALLAAKALESGDDDDTA